MIPKKIGTGWQGSVSAPTLDLYDTDQDSNVSYQLVGNLESDLSKGRISISSPIGKALLGKLIDDEVEVVAPAGKRTYEILSVSYK